MLVLLILPMLVVTLVATYLVGMQKINYKAAIWSLIGFDLIWFTVVMYLG